MDPVESKPCAGIEGSTDIQAAGTGQGESWWGGWSRNRKSPGMRLNGADLLLGAFFAGASAAMALLGLPLSGLPLWGYASFLIFCNVVRIRRIYELVWCAIVAASLGACLLLRSGHPGAIVAASGTAAQVLLILAAGRNGHLRGIGRFRLRGKDDGAI